MANKHHPLPDDDRAHNELIPEHIEPGLVDEKDVGEETSKKRLYRDPKGRLYKG